MRKISTDVHALADYVISFWLIIMPWTLDLRPSAETWMAVGTGIAILVYSLLTDYRFGVFSIISVRSHLMIDLLTGMFLAVAPWLFGFAANVWLPHSITGCSIVAISLLTNPGFSGRLFYSRRRKLHRYFFRTLTVR